MRSRLTHPVLLLLLLALVVSLHATESAAQVLTTHSDPPVVAADSAVQRFFRVWESAWRRSEADRQGRFDGGADVRRGVAFQVRSGAYHCHPMRGDTAWRFPTARMAQIVSAYTWFATCPSWYHGGPGYANGATEEDGIDAAISPARVAEVRAARRLLLDSVTHRVAEAPSESLWTGQLLRFALDQGDRDLARRTTAKCTTPLVWCALLEGYRATRVGEQEAARAAFDSALRRASDDQRCALLDARVLLDNASAQRYAALPCGDRGLVDSWLWLLAELQWQAPAQRRDEHLRRLVEIALRQAWPRDERWTWVDTLGGDARRAMVLRYGWPSFVLWGGPAVDKEHSGAMLSSRAVPVPPFTTFEYTPGRVSGFPTLVDIRDPFALTPSDWSLSPMPGGESYRAADPFWWPQEHMRGAPAVALADLQLATLRRQSTLRVALAVSLPEGSLRRRAGTSTDTMSLFVARHPDTVQVVARARGLVGGSVLVSAELPAAPMLLSLELPGHGRAQPAARARFGVRPPPALAALSTADRAVSAPTLLGVPGGEGLIPPTPAGALPWMLGRTTVPPVGKLGVYWETYGFAPTDTVEHAVWVSRVTPQGALRRLGIRLNVTTDRNTPLAVAWTESQLGATAAVVEPGPVPVIGRTVVLDVSTLAPGEYVLEVAARGTSGDAVREQRRFTVAAR
jgi:hypothetical protein